VGFLCLILGFIGGFWFGYWFVLQVRLSIRQRRALRALKKQFNAMKTQTQDDLYGNLGPEIAKLTSGWEDLK
jgi:hypothetical protein